LLAWTVLAVGLAVAASGAKPGEGYAGKIASLIDPVKRATLKAERTALTAWRVEKNFDPRKDTRAG
jgi:hypothetical protein